MGRDDRPRQAVHLVAIMADVENGQAQLVAQPQDYAWSSHMHYLGVRSDPLITPHALYWDLGNTPFAREAAYAELVQSGISPVQHAALTDATLSGWALGDAVFVADLQKKTERRISKATAGRPLSVTKIQTK